MFLQLAIVTTLAGTKTTAGSADGIGTSASFNDPVGITLDAQGNLYIGEMITTCYVRKITTAGVATKFAGNGVCGYQDGQGTNAKLNGIFDFAVSTAGDMFLCDYYNSRIRKVTSTGAVTTFLGTGSTATTDGTGTNAALYYPIRIGIDTAANLYVTGQGVITTVRKITPGASMSVLAGSTSSGFADGMGTNALFSRAMAVEVDTNGYLFVFDSSAIRKISPTAVVTSFVGQQSVSGHVDGQGTNALFSYDSCCNGLFIATTGTIFVSDRNNYAVRLISSSGWVSTIAGSGSNGYIDGLGTAAAFTAITGITYSTAGYLYTADFGGQTVRRILFSPTTTGLCFYFIMICRYLGPTPTLINRSLDSL